MSQEGGDNLRKRGIPFATALTTKAPKMHLEVDQGEKQACKKCSVPLSRFNLALLRTEAASTMCQDPGSAQSTRPHARDA